MINPNNIVDVNKPVENPKLKSLLLQMKEERTDEIISQVLEEIAMNAHFLSVIILSDEPEQNADGTATFKKDTIMQFPTLISQDEQQFYPVFTDWEELGKWEQLKSPKTLILSFDEYEAMVLQNEEIDGFIINPFSNSYMFFDRDMIEHLKIKKDILTKGIYKQEITKDTEVLLKDPQNYPIEMVNAISNYLRSEKCVSRAWLRLMQRNDECSYLVVADFSGEKEKIFGGIAEAARPFLNDMYIDMVPYEDEFGKNAVENVQPFYAV